jgi:hypothetical protein
MQLFPVAWPGTRESACSDSGRCRNLQPMTGEPGRPSNSRKRKEKPRSTTGNAALTCSAQKIEFGGVHIVHTLGGGSGRTSAGLARIGYVFRSSQSLQGLECGSSPTSGTRDQLVRGDFALTCVQSLWWRPSDAGARAVAWTPAVACSGVWVAGSGSWLVGPPPALYWGYAFLSWLWRPGWPLTCSWSLTVLMT